MKLKFLFFNNWFTLLNEKEFGRILWLKFNYSDGEPPFELNFRESGNKVRIHCRELPSDEMCDLKVYEFSNIGVVADATYPDVDFEIINLSLILIFLSLIILIFLGFLCCKLLIMRASKGMANSHEHITPFEKGGACTPCDSQQQHLSKFSFEGFPVK